MSNKIDIEVIRYHQTDEYYLVWPTSGGKLEKAVWVPRKICTLAEKQMARVPHTWTLTISQEDAEHFGMV